MVKPPDLLFDLLTFVVFTGDFHQYEFDIFIVDRAGLVFEALGKLPLELALERMALHQPVKAGVSSLLQKLFEVFIAVNRDNLILGVKRLAAPRDMVRDDRFFTESFERERTGWPFNSRAVFVVLVPELFLTPGTADLRHVKIEAEDGEGNRRREDGAE